MTNGMVQVQDLGCHLQDRWGTAMSLLLCVCVCVSHVSNNTLFSNLVEYERMLQIHLLFVALGCCRLRLPQRLWPHSALIGRLCGWHPTTVLRVHVLRGDLVQSGLLAGLRHQLHIQNMQSFRWRGDQHEQDQLMLTIIPMISYHFCLHSYCIYLYTEITRRFWGRRCKNCLCGPRSKHKLVKPAVGGRHLCLITATMQCCNV